MWSRDVNLSSSKNLCQVLFVLAYFLIAFPNYSTYGLYVNQEYLLWSYSIFRTSNEIFSAWIKRKKELSRDVHGGSAI